VLTIAYNSERHLEALINSVLAQTYQNWEHIIVDCGSTDQSERLVKELFHCRLRYFRVDYCGLSYGRNYAASKALGEFLAILDSDDLFMPDRLMRQVNYLSLNHNVSGVSSGMVSFSDSSNLIKTYQLKLFADEVKILLRAGFNPVIHSSLMLRAKDFIGINGYSEVIEKAEDFDLLLRLTQKQEVHVLPDILVKYHISDQSHTNRYKPKGRGSEYYAVLSLLKVYSLERNIALSDLTLMRWLDSMDASDIKALLSRWNLNAALKYLFIFPIQLTGLLLIGFCSGFIAVVYSSKRVWTPHVKNPQKLVDYISHSHKE